MRRFSRQRILFGMALVVLVCVGAWSWHLRNDFEADVRRAGGRIRSETVGPTKSPFLRLLSSQKPKVHHWIHFEGSGVSDEWLHAHRADIGQLSNLVLYLRETEITGEGIKALRGMTELNSLVLSGTQLDDRDVVHLAALPSVSSLYIDRTGLSDASLARLSQMPNLGFLSVDSTQATRRGIVGLATCSGLHSLMLWDANDKSVAEVVQHKGLTSLMLIGEAVTGASLPALKRLNGLRTLSLYDAPLTAEEIRELQQALPNCRVRRLESNVLEQLWR